MEVLNREVPLYGQFSSYCMVGCNTWVMLLCSKREQLLLVSGLVVSSMSSYGWVVPDITLVKHFATDLARCPLKFISDPS